MTEPLSIPMPLVALYRQSFNAAPLADPEACLARGLAPFSAASVRPGQRVAIAVGSRGIRSLANLVKTAVDVFRDAGASSVVVPAMGSHGGGTGPGQREVLAGLGITETAVGAPIDAQEDTVALDPLRTPRIFFSRSALAADHLVVINRVKPHTKFRAPIESGLCKMLTIGLGHRAGAVDYHQTAVDTGFGIIETSARKILQRVNLLCGIALIEDAQGNLAHLKVIPPHRLIEEEKALLRQATGLMARIPIDGIDILVVDHMGKDISGIGMDSNVTGRHRDITGDFFAHPHVRRIFARDLSPGADGNGNGIGLADFTTRRLLDALDMEKTRVNALAAISPEKAALPMAFDTDRQALDACFRTCGRSSAEDARLVRIQSTRDLAIMVMSQAMAADAESIPELVRIGPWQPLAFDAAENLLSMPGPGQGG